MTPNLTIGEVKITWLHGGVFELDGGTMFGPVPRVLWEKRFAYHGDNYISLLNHPMLVRAPWGTAIIDTGLGNKLTEKQKKIFRVTEDWRLLESLAEQGVSRDQIDFVVLTHLDYDHAGGVVMHNQEGVAELTFPRAQHIVQRAEWEDAISPNKRAAHSYWKRNFDGLVAGENLLLAEGPHEVMEGLAVFPTGGHTRGHQAVVISSGGQKAVHLADLLPTHAHFNPLWVTSYDNFPLDAVERKEQFEKLFVSQGAWFLFYHDPFMAACRFDPRGEVIEKLDWR